jgi:hypothetical protein
MFKRITNGIIVTWLILWAVIITYYPQFLNESNVCLENFLLIALGLLLVLTLTSIWFIISLYDNLVMLHYTRMLRFPTTTKELVVSMIVIIGTMTLFGYFTLLKFIIPFDSIGLVFLNGTIVTCILANVLSFIDVLLSTITFNRFKGDDYDN